MTVSVAAEAALRPVAGRAGCSKGNHMTANQAQPIVLDYAPVRRARSVLPWLVLAAILELSGAGLLLSGASGPVQGTGCTRSNAARAFVGPNGFLTMAIRMYRFNARQLPGTLVDLLVEPLELQGTGRWKGPYVEDASQLTDPWGNAYQYCAPGVRNKQGFD